MRQIYCIYDHPLDFQNKYVARLWNGPIPTNTVLEADSLQDIRAKIPEGLTLIPRMPADDPVIVECWVEARA